MRATHIFIIITIIYSLHILPIYSQTSLTDSIELSRLDTLRLKYEILNPGLSYINNNVTQDTTLLKEKNLSYFLKKSWVRQSVAPAFLLTSGFLTWGARKDVREARNRYVPDFSVPLDDYLQYAPGAAVLGLNIAGKKGLNDWKRATLNWGTSMAIMGILVNSIKYSARVMRPDGSSRNSFPSGHTATAFTNATFLHREYGPVSPLYSIAGYASSSYVGASRSLNNRHWISDILVGAAIGIISTEVAYAIVDHFYKNRGDNYSKFKIQDEINKPSYFSTRIGYSFYVDDGLSPLGIESTLEGAYYFNKKWGIVGAVTFGDYPIENEALDIEDLESLSIYLQNPRFDFQSMGMLYFMAGPQYTKTIGSKFMLQASLMGGLSMGISGKMSLAGFSDNKETGERTEMSVPLADYKLRPNWVVGSGLSFTGMMTPRVGLSWFFDYKYTRPTLDFTFSKDLFDKQDLDEMNSKDPMSFNNFSTGLRFTAFFD